MKANRRSIVELLIDKGANVNARNIAGDTTMDIAVRGPRGAIVQLLIAKGADVSLPVAVRIEALAKVESLIEEGVDVDIRDKSGNAALAIAISQNEPDSRCQRP